MKKSSYYLCIICFLWLFQLSAGHASQLLLSKEDQDPQSLINNCVSTITGEYCESTIDLEVQGPDPILLSRHYNSSTMGGWRLLPHTLLLIGKKSNQGTVALCGEPTGSILPYHVDRKGELTLDTKVALGIVNTARGDISGQTALTNNRLSYSEKDATYCLVTGNGTQRFYKSRLPKKESTTQVFDIQLFSSLKKQLTGSSLFFLEHEVLPSGNHRFYEYDAYGHIIEIRTTNASESNLLGWVRFEYLLKEDFLEVTVNASNGEELKYTFQKDATGQFCLNSVLSSCGSPIHYFYDKGLLTSIKSTQGKSTSIEYDHESRRVTSLECAQRKSDLSYPKSGLTELKKSNGQKTLFYSDRFLRLEAIEHYELSGDLYKVQRRKWGKRSESTQLLAEYIEDGEGNVLSCTTYTYDPWGNVFEKTLFGKLTGKEPGPIILDRSGMPTEDQQISTHTIHRQFSEDGRNLLLSQKDENGNTIINMYAPGTNLLVSTCIKLAYQGIKRRTFYEYDNNATLIKIIQDNGSSEKSKNLSGVTERHITELTPYSSIPHFGLTKTRTNLFLDLKTKHETPLKQCRFVYDSTGKCLEEKVFDTSHALSYTLKWEYDTQGNITLESDPIGRTKTYTYDDLCNLTTLKEEGVHTSYEYDQYCNLVKQTKNFDSEITLKETFAYDLLGNRVSKTDSFGNETRYSYDSFGRLTQETLPQVLNEKKERVHPTTSYAYDIFDNITSVTDPKGHVTTISYTLRNAPISIHYPDNSEELFTYDAGGTLHRKALRDGTLWIFKYDYLGRITTEEHFVQASTGPGTHLGDNHFRYNAFHLLSSSDENGICSSYSYDDAGRLTSKKIKKVNVGEQTNERTDYSYDALGRVTQENRWYGDHKGEFTTIHTMYDPANRIIEERIEDQIHQYVYDTNDRLIETYIGGALVEKREYNDLGLVNKFTDAEGKETFFHYTYGEGSLSSAEIQPSGQTLLKTFDELNRLSSTTLKNSTNEILSTEEYLYDISGNLSVKVWNGDQRSEWSYGPMNTLILFKEGVGSIHEKKTLFEYDTHGRLIKKHLPGLSSPLNYGYKFRHSSDPMRDYVYPQLEVCITHKSEESPRFISFDLLGNLLEERSYNLRLNRSYGLFNQLLREKIALKGSSPYEMEYSTDRLGRITTLTLPDQSKINYTYDALFPREIRRLTKYGTESYTHEFTTYDSQGRLIQETLQENVGKLNYSYDLPGRKISIHSQFFTQTISEAGYDLAGNLIETHKNKVPYSFCYDEHSHLIEEKTPAQHTFHWDSQHNLLNRNTTTYQINTLNQLIRTDDSTFTYDSRGYLTHKQTPTEEFVFEHNPFGELTRISCPQNKTITNIYDIFGRRLSRKVSENAKELSHQRFVFAGMQEIGTLNKKDRLTELQVIGPAYSLETAKAVSFEFDGEAFLPLFDIQGNVTMLIDPWEEEIIETYDYSPFGQEHIFDATGAPLSTSSLNNPYRFAGKRKDELTGLIAFGLRDYDPSTARWIQPDPLGPIDTPNLYTYLRGNPLKYHDALGLSSEHYYVKHDSFEDYFFYNRRNPSDSGGELGQYIEATTDFITNVHIGGIEAAAGIEAPSPNTTSGAYGRHFGKSAIEATALIQLGIGISEIGAGLFGLAGSATAEVLTYGAATAAAIPVASDSLALIADGAVKLGIGSVLLKNASQSKEIKPSRVSRNRTEQQQINPKIYTQLENQFSKDGKKSIYKALRSSEKSLREHKNKLPTLTYKSQVEGTIKNVEKQISTINKFIRDHNL